VSNELVSSWYTQVRDASVVIVLSVVLAQSDRWSLLPHPSEALKFEPGSGSNPQAERIGNQRSLLLEDVSLTAEFEMQSVAPPI